MKPTYQQLTLWCSVYNISLLRSKCGVEAIARGLDGDILARATADIPVDKLPAQRDDIDRAIVVCDEIADEMLIPSPSLMMKLKKLEKKAHD